MAAHSPTRTSAHPSSVSVASPGTVFAAIDVGTNASRVVVVRMIADGAWETLHTDRSPVRPGEGVFKTGRIPPHVADRLVTALTSYAMMARKQNAVVRAVATSALREASNRDEVIARVREEAGIELEVISGQEEARLICLGVLHGKPVSEQSVLIDIGGGSTEVAIANGEEAVTLLSVPLGSVRLTELFGGAQSASNDDLDLMRRYACQVVESSILEWPTTTPKVAIGSSGTIRNLVAFGAPTGANTLTLRQLTRATKELVDMGPAGRAARFDASRAEIIVAGSVILEAVMQRIRLDAVTACDGGLREGLIVDLARRAMHVHDHTGAGFAVGYGRRLGFDEKHHRQVARIACMLFDGLNAVHGESEETRDLLEISALLHDIGYVVNRYRHHKHSQYLIENADIPGVSGAEKRIVALIARFHRRSTPRKGHPALEGLSLAQTRTVRQMSMLLRIADALDRSHQGYVQEVKARVVGEAVTLRLQSKSPLDLELWDAEREAPFFRETFGKDLVFKVERPS